jgi:hypothetical protein
MRLQATKTTFVKLSLIFLALIALASIGVAYLLGNNIPSSGVQIEADKGPLYNTLFTISEPGQFHLFTTMPDGSFAVADNATGQLIRYDQTGRQLSKIDLSALDIAQVADIQATKAEIVLLEVADLGSMPIPYRIDRLTFDGKVLSKIPIPTDFAPDINLNIANYIQAILMDCSDNLYLEIAGTSALYALTDIQQQKSPINGLLCRDKRYRLEAASPGGLRFMVGDQQYGSKSSGQLMSLRLLHVFDDGGFLLGREDVMNGSPIQVDWTIHYIDAAGNEAGVARVPLSEFFSTQGQKISVGRDGQVYLILPREKASDIIRLHFFQQLGPLAPGAAAPIIERIKP